MKLKWLAAGALVTGILAVLAKTAASASEEFHIAKPGETRVQVNNRHYFITAAGGGQHRVERRDEKTNKVMGSALVKKGSIVELYGEEGQDDALAQLATDLPKFPSEVWK